MGAPPNALVVISGVVGGLAGDWAPGTLDVARRHFESVTILTIAANVRSVSSLLGIAWLAATTTVMFTLAFAKARTNARSVTASRKPKQR